ncbi:hypothetical protein O181_087864 [Austropuccinia psidii MF-1]|uniref:Reverse transcriptase Ty1/copia-type domain-containing protein n=1 Tax=Austropuccinia psidii MF-1 TaxID=1389203 RepID=A0A9Q3P2F8_9BASI|nr:hypothetical protein [Austropuccinia psidii MF-1]
MLHYYDTWASVGRNETFKAMLSLVMSFKYIPYQFDIKTAFLHGEMDALVYVKQVKGYEVKGKEGWVWRLFKSLYGTKQAPRHASSQPVLFNDNSGEVTFSKQASLNANTKHIEVRYQYVCDCAMKNLIKVVQVSTNDMIADVLTKPLGVLKLQEVYKQLHLKDPGGVLKIEENHLGWIRPTYQSIISLSE